MQYTKLSSRGQVVIPAGVRDRKGWKEGTKFKVQDTPYGLFLFPVSKKPLQSLRGILRGTSIRSSEVKAMRKREEHA